VALSAICPLISAKVASNDRAFDTVLLDHQNVGDAANLAWKAVFADWRRDKNVTSVRADRVELSAGGRIPALLDGEKVFLPRSTEIRYSKACFGAIVPATYR
jgi:diacylglycerol kinase family enzyme